MSSVTSLRRKDNMWIYKNPQGLQLLNDELEQRRNKRFARSRSNTSPQAVPSPPLSPKQQHSSFREEPIEELIPIAKKIAIVKIKEISKQQKPAEEKKRETQPYPQLPTRSPVEIKQDTKSTDEKRIPKQQHIKEKSILQQEQVATEEKRPYVIKKEQNPVLEKTQHEQKVIKVKKILQLPSINSTLQEKKEALKQCAMQDKPLRTSSPPIRVSSPMRVTSPIRVSSPPIRVSSPIRATSPIKASSSPERVFSTITKPENNFLLEAKQKLFSNQQQKTNIVRKSLSNTPTKKNGLVSSFISSFETPPASKCVTDLPPKPPRHVIMPLVPTSSISTPLSPPAVENIVPVTSSSSILPIIDSYFSAVIDRRFNGTPTEEQTEEEPIQVYLPQLSPEISFCGSTLDVPSDDEYIPQERPCIKKRVSFSEQLSTYIPEDDASVSTEEEERLYSPITKFVRTLSNELTDVSTQYGGRNGIDVHPREKFLPLVVDVKKKEVGPQRLSNKLLDMFQKKPKVVDQPTTRELTHLTKSRPRKPASLKKPTTLTYPAAIAQPDWRTRAILTKKSSVFI